MNSRIHKYGQIFPPEPSTDTDQDPSEVLGAAKGDKSVGRAAPAVSVGRASLPVIFQWMHYGNPRPATKKSGPVRPLSVDYHYASNGGPQVRPLTVRLLEDEF
ncbi:MAG: hypothetical protein RDU20_01560 [Desulfomonilaceae bacterium]|nr:hypothetical protein [Desulfomonilaceae bacterium]